MVELGVGRVRVQVVRSASQPVSMRWFQGQSGVSRWLVLVEGEGLRPGQEVGGECR